MPELRRGTARRCRLLPALHAGAAGKGIPQAAAPLADELAETIRRHELEDWQRDLCVDALRVCHAVWSGLETPEARQRAAEAAAAIARLRPSRSPYL